MECGVHIHISYTHKNVYKCVCTYVNMYIHKHVYKCVCTYINNYMCVCTYINNYMHQ